MNPSDPKDAAYYVPANIFDEVINLIDMNTPAAEGPPGMFYEEAFGMRKGAQEALRIVIQQWASEWLKVTHGILKSQLKILKERLEEKARRERRRAAGKKTKS